MEERKETKKTQVEKEVVKEAVKVRPTPAQPEEAAPVVKTVKPKNKQTMITLAIVSGIILFFLGLGLGYLLGHSTVAKSRNGLPTNGNFTPPSGGGDRRFYPNSGTNNNTNDSSDTNTNTQTN